MAGKKYIGIAGIITGLVLIGAYFAYIKYDHDMAVFTREAPDILVTYEGIAPDQSFTVRLGSSRFSVEGRNGELRLSDEQKAVYKLPVTIEAAITGANDRFHDFAWKIDRQGVDYAITASGFSPDDRISLIMDGQRVYTIPFDWSGRIELPIILILDKDTKACIEIKQAAANDTDSPIGFCHFITGRKAA
ncbi:MAG: hypothetical protein WC989_06960 [Micavibrio sp.]